MALIGQDISPPDLRAKVTGRAKYAEDFRAEGMVFAKLLDKNVIRISKREAPVLCASQTAASRA